MEGSMRLLILLCIALGALLFAAVRRGRRREKRVTRTCITCAHLGASDRCAACNGSGSHWVERQRRSA